MLDLKKYLKKAEADPGFKARLIQDANQAIKDEFGEDLPCKLKCKEKLSFEIEAMDEMSDTDVKSVAGGERTAAWNATHDTNRRAASAYRRAYGFSDPKPQIFGPNVPGRTVDPFIKSNDGSYDEEHEHWYNKRSDGFVY